MVKGGDASIVDSPGAKDVSIIVVKHGEEGSVALGIVGT